MSMLRIRESTRGNLGVEVGGEESDVNDKMRKTRVMEFDENIYRPRETRW